MKRLHLFVALVVCAVSSNKAGAQVLKWADKFPKEGSQASYVYVKGTVDLKKANVDRVFVYGFLNGGKKPSVALELAVDLDGNWGGANGTNLGAPNAKGGDIIQIIVEARVNADTIFILSGSAKSKQ